MFEDFVFFGAAENLIIKPPNRQRNCYMSILNLNVQCLSNKIDEISIFLNDGDYDVISLTETWMTSETMLNINIPNYRIAANYSRLELK